MRSDIEELVKKMRSCAKDEPRISIAADLLNEAADVIEELDREIESWIFAQKEER